MKRRQIPWKHLKKGGTFLLLAALSLNGCFLKQDRTAQDRTAQDRTTMVYGTVMDKYKKPLEGAKISILSVSGLYKNELLREVYTNKTGEYEIAFDIPKKHRSIHLSLPIVDLTQFQNYPSGYLLYKDGIETQECCPARIGEKTKYDFIVLF